MTRHGAPLALGIAGLLLAACAESDGSTMMRPVRRDAGLAPRPMPPPLIPTTPPSPMVPTSDGSVPATPPPSFPPPDGAVAPPPGACAQEFDECATAACCAGLTCISEGIDRFCARASDMPPPPPPGVDGGSGTPPPGACGMIDDDCATRPCCMGLACRDFGPEGRFCDFGDGEPPPPGGRDAGTGEGMCADYFEECSPTRRCCPGLTCYPDPDDGTMFCAGME